MVEALKSKNAPRLSIDFSEDKAGGYSGTELGGVTATTSGFGSIYASVGSLLPLVTYFET